jgi:hypothetical protein
MRGLAALTLLGLIAKGVEARVLRTATVGFKLVSTAAKVGTEHMRSNKQPAEV